MPHKKKFTFVDYQLPGLPRLHSHSWGKTGRSSSKTPKATGSSEVLWKHKRWAAPRSWWGPAAPRWSPHHGWHCDKCPVFHLPAEEWGGQDTKLTPATDWKTTNVNKTLHLLHSAPTNKWDMSGHYLQLFLPFLTWKCQSSGYSVF